MSDHFIAEAVGVASPEDQATSTPSGSLHGTTTAATNTLATSAAQQPDANKGIVNNNNLDYQYAEGITPEAFLHLCYMPYEDRVKRLITSGHERFRDGAWHKFKMNDGTTALHYAAYYGRVGVIRVLLEALDEHDARVMQAWMADCCGVRTPAGFHKTGSSVSTTDGGVPVSTTMPCRSEHDGGGVPPTSLKRQVLLQVDGRGHTLLFGVTHPPTIKAIASEHGWCYRVPEGFCAAATNTSRNAAGTKSSSAAGGTDSTAAAPAHLLPLLLETEPVDIANYTVGAGGRQTPLSYLIRNGTLAAAKALIECGAHVSGALFRRKSARIFRGTLEGATATPASCGYDENDDEAMEYGYALAFGDGTLSGGGGGSGLSMEEVVAASCGIELQPDSRRARRRAARGQQGGGARGGGGGGTVPDTTASSPHNLQQPPAPLLLNAYRDMAEVKADDRNHTLLSYLLRVSKCSGAMRTAYGNTPDVHPQTGRPVTLADWVALLTDNGADPWEKGPAAARDDERRRCQKGVNEEGSSGGVGGVDAPLADAVEIRLAAAQAAGFSSSSVTPGNTSGDATTVALTTNPTTLTRTRRGTAIATAHLYGSSGVLRPYWAELAKN